MELKCGGEVIGKGLNGFERECNVLLALAFVVESFCQSYKLS